MIKLIWQKNATLLSPVIKLTVLWPYRLNLINAFSKFTACNLMYKCTVSPLNTTLLYCPCLGGCTSSRVYIYHLQREILNKLRHSNTISSFVTICQRHFALNYLRLDLFQPRRRVLCIDRRNSGSLKGALGFDSGSIRNILIKNTAQNGCSCFFVDGYPIPADSKRISNIGRSRT